MKHVPTTSPWANLPKPEREPGIADVVQGLNRCKQSIAKEGVSFHVPQNPDGTPGDMRFIEPFIRAGLDDDGAMVIGDQEIILTKKLVQQLVPHGLNKSVIETYNQREWADRIKAQSAKTGLYFSPKPGTGKRVKAICEKTPEKPWTHTVPLTHIAPMSAEQAAQWGAARKGKMGDQLSAADLSDMHVAAIGAGPQGGPHTSDAMPLDSWGAEVTAQAIANAAAKNVR